MNIELTIIAGFIDRAICVEDVFGKIGTTRKEQESGLKQAYHRLTRVIHPDKYDTDPTAKALAENSFKNLVRILSIAETIVKQGSYGTRAKLPWKIPTVIKGKYVIESPYCAGNIADLYSASLESSKQQANLLLKVARGAADNDLLRNEANVLNKIRQRMKEKGSPDWPGTIPHIIDSFLLEEKGQRRAVNVMERFEGFYNAVEIRNALPNGVDGRTLAWMWKRLLVLMEWIAKIGYIHGAILPSHVMFFPDNDGNVAKDKRKHSIRLVDWCYAVEYKNRTRLSAWVSFFKDFYAPEVIERKPLGPWTDLYMGAMTMLYLAGAKMNSKGVVNLSNPEVPMSIQAELFRCVVTKPKDRPQSVGTYFEQFSAVVRKEYGPPKYHNFDLPH
jgi:hypothetical protein